MCVGMSVDYDLERRHGHGAFMVLVWRRGLGHIMELRKRPRVGPVMWAERR